MNRDFVVICRYDVAKTYLPFIFYLIVTFLLFQLISTLYDNKFNLVLFFNNELTELNINKNTIFTLSWKSLLLLALVVWYYNHREQVRLSNLCYYTCLQSIISVFIVISVLIVYKILLKH